MNKIKIAIFSLLGIVVILAGVVIFSATNSITGEAVKDKYTYTKAICNETNYCEDYEISCENNQFTGMSPTGAAIQHKQEWTDPRDEEVKEKLC